MFIGSTIDMEKETQRINTWLRVFGKELLLDFLVGLLQANTWILLLAALADSLHILSDSSV